MYHDNYNLWDRTPICTKLVIYGRTPKDYTVAWRIWRYVNKIHMTAGQPASQLESRMALSEIQIFWHFDIWSLWTLIFHCETSQALQVQAVLTPSCLLQRTAIMNWQHLLPTIFTGSHCTCLTNAINKSRILLIFDYQSYLNTVEHNSSLSSSSSTPHPPGPPLHSQPFKFSSLLASSLKFWSFSTSPNHFWVDHLQPPFNHFPTAHALACEAHLVQFARNYIHKPLHIFQDLQCALDTFSAILVCHHDSTLSKSMGFWFFLVGVATIIFPLTILSFSWFRGLPVMPSTGSQHIFRSCSATPPSWWVPNGPILSGHYFYHSCPGAGTSPVLQHTCDLVLRLSWLLMESQVSRSLVQVSRSSVLGRPLFKAEDVEWG